MRKNYYNWWRRPVCSLMEILVPALSMLCLVYWRSQIDITTTNFNLFGKELKTPTFPALNYSSKNQSWSKNRIFGASIDDRLSDFFYYSHYPIYKREEGYHMSRDPRSPIFFIPSHCFVENSFQTP